MIRQLANPNHGSVVYNIRIAYTSSRPRVVAEKIIKLWPRKLVFFSGKIFQSVLRLMRASVAEKSRNVSRIPGEKTAPACREELCSGRKENVDRMPSPTFVTSCFAEWKSGAIVVIPC